MVFYIVNLINGLKAIDGFNVSNANLLNAFYYKLIMDKNIATNKGDLIDYTDQRASELMNGKVPLYQSITRFSNFPETRTFLQEKIDYTFDHAFKYIDIKVINKVLVGMVNRDVSFDKKMKEDINNYPSDSKLVLADCLFYCLQYDEVRNLYLRKLNNPNEIIKDNLVDVSTIGTIVNAIAKYKKAKHSTKIHHKAYSLEDKLQKNRISGAIYHRISKAFDDYDYVIDAIETLCEDDVFAAKEIYSFYNETYFSVLDEMNIKETNIDEIIDNSEVIFKKINDKIYYDVLYGLNLGISIEKAKLNLFSITTAIFYKCKFLIPLEGDESDSN